MKTLFRLPLLALGVCSLSGCDDATTPLAGYDSDLVPASAEIEHIVTRVPLDLTFFDTCGGEEVQYTGYVHVVSHTGANRGVDLDEIFQHSVEISSTHLSGVGLESGAKYEIRGPFNEIIQSESPDDPFPLVNTLVGRTEIVRVGDGIIGHAIVSFVIVFDASGDIATIHATFDVDDCLLGP